MTMRSICLGVLLAALVSAQAPQRDLLVESSDRRLALVIGNEAYPKWPLRNPANDARAMAKTLGELGFEPELVLNGNLRTLEAAVNKFVGRIRPGDVAMFFYAGHGIQLAGENYLVPVDFDARTEADAKYAAYSLSRVLDRMEEAGARISLLVLDACRNNPFKTSRSGGGGLAAMSTGKGTLIGFATAPGKTADDNPAGQNGLFTSHLIRALREPGLSLDQIFNRVRAAVHDDSGGAQVPWTVSSVIGEFYFKPAAGGSAAAGGGSPAGPNPLFRRNSEGGSAMTAAAVSGTENPLARRRPSPGDATGETGSRSDPSPAPGDIRELLSEAGAALERGDAEQAIAKANEAVRLNPNDGPALKALASAQWAAGQYEVFVGAARQALDAGEKLVFLLGHHHTLTGIHASTLTLGGGRIVFNPAPVAGAACNQAAFDLPLSKVAGAAISTSGTGIYLALKVQDERGKTRSLNFADPDSQLDTSGGLPAVVSPPKSTRSLGAIVSLLTAGR